MKKQRLLVFLTLICIVALMLPLAVSAAEIPDNGWYQNADKSWSFRRDGQWVMDEVIKLGAKYYGFDAEGYMITNEQFWCDGYYYCASADGTLLQSKWYQDADGNWYFYEADATPADYDFKQMGKTWYFFHWDGRMASDELVWSDAYNGYYVINKAGTDSKRLGAGWTQAYGSWYYGYMEDDSLTIACDKFVEYGGKLFYFDYEGKMIANQRFWNGESERDYVATADGSILRNGWAQVGGSWYYAKDDVLADYGVYTIGTKNYYFQDCKMYNIPGELSQGYYEEYYVNADGTLLQNQWRNDTIGEPDAVGWAYYGADSCKVKETLVTIGNVPYYFNDYGIMQTNTVRDRYDGVYVFDKDGKGKEVNGWFQHPENKRWMYAIEDDLAYGMMTIGAATYAFDYDGYMITENYKYNSGDYYLFDKDGKLVTKTGFVSVGGSWYWVENSDGQLRIGWKQSGNKWYCFLPNMMANTVFQDPDSTDYYAADNNGACTQLTGSGWRQMSWGRIYLVSGKPIVDDWSKIGNAWYYFDEYGEALIQTSRVIDGKRYVFDTDGKMCTNGWVKLWEDDYYVDANGVAATGMKTIGGKQYIFSNGGWLYRNGVCEYEGKNYWLNSDGSVRAVVKEGWNQIGSKWYYMRDGEMLCNALLTQGDVRYGFGSDYAMCTNGVKYAWYDYYMFDANGKILTGWQKFDGKWYYAYPGADDPRICTEGVEYIGGKEYLFKDGCLFVGTTMMYGTYYTTDSNGVVISRTEMKDGWNYVGDGYVYLKNGEAITGWVGDYYVEDGYMLVNQGLEYAGKYYWLGADGRYIKGGWYELPFDEYIYANSDGTLKCSEWLQVGGKYYYFYDIYMVRGFAEINGQYHEFNESGVWLGQVDNNVTYPSMSDGWHKIGGKWYYYHAGARQFGARYIDGKWYYFDGSEDGAMVTNGFGGSFYYGSTGVRATYTGWKKIDGYWIYFDEDYSVHSGWIKSGSGWYYTDYIYDEDREQMYYAMIANKAVVYNDQLYCFNSSGYCAGAVTGTGWTSCGGVWYYTESGSVVSDSYYQIGKDFYYFNYEGEMITNDIGYVKAAAGRGQMYFGADGKAVKTAGWKQTEYGWIYIGANGFLYQHGIYRIGGKDYSFCDCIWVQ